MLNTRHSVRSVPGRSVVVYEVARGFSDGQEFATSINVANEGSVTGVTTFSYVDDDEPESYLNCIRAERMLQECNARELQCFLNAGLLDVSGDSLSDPDSLAMSKITLLELVRHESFVNGDKS